MNEAELLQVFRESRSESAFARLVSRYAGLVYSVAKRRSANPALAEDIAQLVFIRFAKAPPSIKTEGELAAWLHRTTVHVTIDAWRSEIRRRAREEMAVTMETINSEPAAWANIAPKLDEALDQLSEEDRRALLLRYFGEKSMREVGTALGVSEDAAKMRVSRAVDRLRTQMGVGSAACTTAVLGLLMTQRCVEAAPAHLLERPAAIKIPALAGASGLAAALIQLSRHKLVATTVGLAIVATLAIYFAQRASSSSTVQTTKSESATMVVTNETNPSPRLVDSILQANSSAAKSLKAVKIRFHVLDAETGQGLANAKIHAAYFGTGGAGEAHDLLSDAAGFADIPQPDDSAKQGGPNVFVLVENHVPKVVGFGSTVPAEYEIKLDPAMVTSGLVIDEQGMPVSDVRITIQSGGNVPGQMENIDFQRCSVTTLDNGTWSCNYLPRDIAGILRFALHKPGYAVTVTRPPDHTSDMNHVILVIDRGFVISGRVTDAQNNPVSKARLTTLGSDSVKKQAARTDENGFFTLADLSGIPEDGRYRNSFFETNDAGERIIRGNVGKGPLHAELVIQADGFAPVIRRVELSNHAQVANFTLPPGNIFRGRVLDESGNPIARAVVQTDADFEHQVAIQFPWRTKTDSSGRFIWTGAPREPVCYWFAAAGYKDIRGLSLYADDTEHEIILKR